MSTNFPKTHAWHLQQARYVLVGLHAMQVPFTKLGGKESIKSVRACRKAYINAFKEPDAKNDTSYHESSLLIIRNKAV
jgi:hypothetical protein